MAQFRIQYSMGNSPNGKDDHSYYAQQLSLFKWRADPNHNVHLPRVRFSNRLQYLQKYRFCLIVEDQLQQHLFLDVDAIWQKKEKEEVKKGGDVIVFEQFVARLDQLQNSLELSECIYVLMALLEGYQRILYRIGKTHIELFFCFVTPEGDIRAWFSDNPTTNDLAQQLEEGRKNAVYSSQAGVVKRVIELSKKLSQGGGNYFWEELRQFVIANMLQNCNFISVRRFVNRYLFLHRITLPSGVGKYLRRKRIVKFGRASSLEKIDIKDDSHIATRGKLSTYTQLDYLKPPASPHGQRQTSSISIKGESLNCETGSRTPKTENKLSPLDSTFINSQLFLSHGKENKKIQNFHKSRNGLPQQQSQQPKQSCTFPEKSLPFLKKRKAEEMAVRSGKFSVKFHSRQSSQDQQNNSMFIMPKNKQVQSGIEYSHAAQIHHWPKQSENSNQDFYQPTSADKLTSQILARQVSGLVSNKELSICESMGTFQSIENSKDSGYMGVLNKMGRTAKILNFPTGKRLATFFRNNAEKPNIY